MYSLANGFVFRINGKFTMYLFIYIEYFYRSAVHSFVGVCFFQVDGRSIRLGCLFICIESPVSKRVGELCQRIFVLVESGKSLFPDE